MTFRLRSERAKRWAIRAYKYRSPKGDRILPESAIKSNLYHLVDAVSKIEKVPKGIRGEKSSKDMASSRN